MSGGSSDRKGTLEIYGNLVFQKVLLPRIMEIFRDRYPSYHIRTVTSDRKATCKVIREQGEDIKREMVGLVGTMSCDGVGDYRTVREEFNENGENMVLVEVYSVRDNKELGIFEYLLGEVKEKNHNPRDFYIRTITVGAKKKNCMMRRICNPTEFLMRCISKG